MNENKMWERKNERRELKQKKIDVFRFKCVTHVKHVFFILTRSATTIIRAHQCQRKAKQSKIQQQRPERKNIVNEKKRGNRCTAFSQPKWSRQRWKLLNEISPPRPPIEVRVRCNMVEREVELKIFSFLHFWWCRFFFFFGFIFISQFEWR